MTRRISGDVRSGLRLSFLNTLFAGLAQFAIMMVLARLLSPEEYGDYALCVAIVTLSAIFVTNVSERMLILADNKMGECDHTLAIGLLCLLAGAVALGICIVLNRAGITHINIDLLLLTFGASITNAAAVTPRVLLRRNIRFGPIALSETSGLLLGQGATAITLAFWGLGPYALVAGTLVQGALIAVLLRVYAPPRSIVVPSYRQIRDLIRSSAALGGNAAIEIINSQMAPLVLGTRVGPAALGLFNRSYSLIQIPIQLLVSSMGRVMISSLFSVSEDKARLQSMSRTLVRIASVATAPVAAGMAGASHNFVLFAFGPNWLAAAQIMPLLAISAWATMMGTLFAMIAEAKRAFAAKTKTQAFSTLMLIVLVFCGAKAGLLGAVAGIAISSCLFLFLFARLASRILEIPTSVAFGWLVPGIIVGLPCLATSMGLGHFLNLSSVAIFAAQITGCGITASIMLLLLYPGLALQIADGMVPGIFRMLPWLDQYLRRAANRKVAE